MKTNELIWRIAGGSGDGIDSTSRNFATALMRSGLNVFTHRHFPSRIRGGHTYVEVRAGPDPVSSRGDGFNCLLALGDSFARNPDEDAYYDDEKIKPLSENLDDLQEGGIIVYDDGVLDTDNIEHFDERVEQNNWHVYPVDLQAIARKHGRDVMRNTAGVGVIASLIGFDLTYIEEIIGESMSGEIKEQNIQILREASDHVESSVKVTHDFQIPTGEHEEEQVLLSGSNAIAYGALDAGCRFISGYPMTPWTDVFTIMTQHLPDFGGMSEQVEDEIAAVNVALGASHAGVKAMSGSSGGGFSLMTESLGLAEQTETPIVLLEAMRAGPSTGMPTKPEQSDLEHVLYSSQGDSARVAFAPGSHRECYEHTRLAFKLAYEYHLPAIVIYDQKVQGENRNLPKSFFDREVDADPGRVISEEELKDAIHDASGKFHRYDTDAETAAPRSVPGQTGGRYLASSNEHLPSGHITEVPEIRTAQMDRRMGKVEAVREDLNDFDGQLQTYFGSDDATYGIITWGSMQGTLREAVSILREEGNDVQGLSIGQMAPFPHSEVRDFLSDVDSAVVLEMNASGQLANLIKRELGDFGNKLVSLLKYDGEPFQPREVVEGYKAEIDGDGSLSGNATIKQSAGD